MSKKIGKNNRLFRVIINPIVYLLTITAIVIMMTNGMNNMIVAFVAIFVALVLSLIHI